MTRSKCKSSTNKIFRLYEKLTDFQSKHWMETPAILTFRTNSREWISSSRIAHVNEKAQSCHPNLAYDILTRRITDGNHSIKYMSWRAPAFMTYFYEKIIFLTHNNIGHFHIINIIIMLFFGYISVRTKFSSIWCRFWIIKFVFCP